MEVTVQMAQDDACKLYAMENSIRRLEERKLKPTILRLLGRKALGKKTKKPRTYTTPGPYKFIMNRS